jgi:c-di-GMP-related signal transduction protein
MKYMARQPILTRERELFGYELLFRNGIQNSCDGMDLEMASTSVLDTSFLIGLEKISAGHPMFFNCPREFLVRDYVSLFPPQSIVVEILETINPDEEVIAVCTRLKERGYSIALDDFVDSAKWAPLVALADIIKVDFRLTSAKEQREIVARHAGKKIKMLAEKVETQEEFAAAMDMGYALFQGYFFCHPEMLMHRRLPTFKLTYLELLRAATAPEFNIHDLAVKIKYEPSLTFRLLRYLNSAAFGLRAEIHSVEHALSLLGERELRKWIVVVCVGVVAEGKPDELMTVPLIRARFCELLAPIARIPGDSDDLFLMGLLSLMDAILDQSIESILKETPVRTEIKDALLHQKGLYWQLLEITIAHEQADWPKVSQLLTAMGMNEEQVSGFYISAVDWCTALRQSAFMPAAR